MGKLSLSVVLVPGLLLWQFTAGACLRLMVGMALCRRWQLYMATLWASVLRSLTLTRTGIVATSDGLTIYVIVYVLRTAVFASLDLLLYVLTKKLARLVVRPVVPALTLWNPVMRPVASLYRWARPTLATPMRTLEPNMCDVVLGLMKTPNLVVGA